MSSCGGQRFGGAADEVGEVAGGGGHGAVAEVGVEGDHEAGGAFVEAERQELFAFLARG